MTCYDSIIYDVVNSGAEYVDQEVVVDGNLISGKHYRSNGIFMQEVVKWLLAKA